MCDTIGAVTVTEDKSMIGRQLPSYRVDAQIHPSTCTDFHVQIVSNLGAEAADRNVIFHDIFPPALAPILNECPRYRPFKGRNRVNRLTKPFFSPDESLSPFTKAILNDHQVDNLATGNTAPGTNTVMPVTARLNEEIRRTHEPWQRWQVIRSLPPSKQRSRFRTTCSQFPLDLASFTVCHTRPLIPSPHSFLNGAPHRIP